MRRSRVVVWEEIRFVVAGGKGCGLRKERARDGRKLPGVSVEGDWTGEVRQLGIEDCPGIWSK